VTRRAYAKLTLREEQRIVALRAEGLTLAAIADRLGCSKASVCAVLQAHKEQSGAPS
jgi:DNA-binding CsgD family transcriptional regulator